MPPANASRTEHHLPRACMDAFGNTGLMPATQQGIAITQQAAATWLPEELRTATGPPRERPTENELGKRKKHLGIAALGASCLEARAGVEPTYTDLQSGA